MDKGPDGYEHVLSAVFNHIPSPAETMAALRATEAELVNQDGRSDLVEHGVMDDDLQAAMDAGLAAGATFLGAGGRRSTQ